MADASYPFDARRRRPRDWGEALASLPLETPPLSVWTQIEARLDAADRAASDAAATECAVGGAIERPIDAANGGASRHRRAALSLRGWMALAASLSALALLPAIWFAGRDDGAGASPVVAHASTAPSIAAPASPNRGSVAVSPVDAARAAAATPQVASLVRPREATEHLSIVPPTDAAHEASAMAAPETVSEPTLPPLASVAPPTASPLAPIPSETSVDATNERDALPPGAVLVGDVDADVTGREMEMLYAASAQLETLLTYTRDPRVETGPAAALASQIHTRLAKIDARLAMPGLSDGEQYALWRARVGTLRQAVAFESEQRALAAEGQVYEGELVEVY